MPRGETRETKHRKQLILDWAEQNHPVTVRQIFYRLSTLDAVPKTENGYKMIGRLCTKMRRAGEIDFDWFADNTRWMRKPRTYNSIQDALSYTAETYRRALWQNQAGLVEIWLEKEALAGVVHEVTEKWDVPLMVVRGYPSLSFLHTAAKEIIRATQKGKISHIFYLGDYDPSGLDIYRAIVEDLNGFAPDAQMTMQRMAVTQEQIREWDLPSRPTKKTDSRAKGFTGESVELDAITPDNLRQIVSECIESVVDSDALEKTLHIEQLERESIPNLLESLSDPSEKSKSNYVNRYGQRKRESYEIDWRVPSTPVGNQFIFSIESKRPLPSVEAASFSLTTAEFSLTTAEEVIELNTTNTTLYEYAVETPNSYFEAEVRLDGTYKGKYAIAYKGDFVSVSPEFHIDSSIGGLI